MHGGEQLPDEACARQLGVRFPRVSMQRVYSLVMRCAQLAVQGQAIHVDAQLANS